MKLIIIAVVMLSSMILKVHNVHSQPCPSGSDVEFKGIVTMYILSCVRVSINMYEAKRAVAGCSCSGKEHLNNLRITNNLKNTKFPELVNSNELVFHVT